MLRVVRGLGQSIRLGETSKVVFFLMRDNELFEKEWSPERKNHFGCPISFKKGHIVIVRSDPMIKNKFIINNN